MDKFDEYVENLAKADKEIFEKVYSVIGELSNIEHKYGSWDLWAQSNSVFKARSILLEEFKKEIEERIMINK